MTSGVAGWLEILADKQVPVLKASRKQALSVLTDDKQATSALIPILLSDPGMAANLFRPMNLPRKKQNRLQISTVESLVSLMGEDQLLKAIRPMPVYEDLGLPEENLQGIHRCLKQRWYAEYFAMTWVTERGVREPAEVRIAAALQLIPELMLWSYGGDVMRKIEHLAYYEGKIYYEVVEQILGCSKREIGVELSKQWELPEVALFGFETSYDSYTNASAVGLAALLARICQHSLYSEDMEFFLEKAKHYFGEIEQLALNHLHRQLLRMVYDEMDMGYRPVAFLMLDTRLKPGPDRHYIYDLMLTQKWRDEPVNEVQERPPVKPAQEEEIEIAERPEADAAHAMRVSVADVHERMKQLMRERSGLNDFIREMCIFTIDTLGLARCGFLLLNKDKTSLEVKLSKFDNNADQGIRQLVVDLQPANLFSHVMKKPQAFWLNEGNYEKYWGMISGSVKTVIHVDHFVVASVFFGERPVGMMYADNQNGAISEEQFRYFQQTASLLNQALKVLSKQAQ